MSLDVADRDATAKTSAGLAYTQSASEELTDTALLPRSRLCPERSPSRPWLSLTLVIVEAGIGL